MSSSSYACNPIVITSPITTQLWVSTNLGANWTLLGVNITNYNWRLLNSTWESDTMIYYEQIINGKFILMKITRQLKGIIGEVEV